LPKEAPARKGKERQRKVKTLMGSDCASREHGKGKGTPGPPAKKKKKNAFKKKEKSNIQKRLAGGRSKDSRSLWVEPGWYWRKREQKKKKRQPVLTLTSRGRDECSAVLTDSLPKEDTTTLDKRLKTGTSFL